MNVDALREALEAGDRRRYTELLAEDVRFFSPIEAEPSRGREAASMVLSTVFEEVFEDFRYANQVGRATVREDSFFATPTTPTKP